MTDAAADTYHGPDKYVQHGAGSTEFLKLHAVQQAVRQFVVGEHQHQPEP
jgi:hypothetical protein